MTKAALPHLCAGSSIINTTSVTAYRGEKTLIDYSSTKGAIVSFTRSLSLSLIEQGIRVNGIAPGPIWTPLIPATFSAERVKTFGGETPMKRAGQPFELAPAYVFLASDDSAYMSGQVLHVNGGEMVES
jgi:NAD(P)-dependent dehydrogenase (short-subunit alcohol dehydrogenase family)